jgi:hypothetical protein
MAARTYQNFDLSLEAAGQSSFRARVAYCPVGDSPSVAFSLPFEGTQLEMLIRNGRPPLILAAPCSRPFFVMKSCSPGLDPRI